MKKKILILLASWLAALGFAKEKFSGRLAVGGNAVEKTDGDAGFGNLYLLANISAGNDYVTAGGKFYYRLNLSDDSKDLDADKTVAQKYELKRAYLRVRPLGNEILELSIGKLYSYYLTGNYFHLSEIYTGSSRWGKTGVGIKYEDHGLTAGLALPLTESYAEFKNSFGINGALEYDFKTLKDELPLKIGATVLYSRTSTEVKNKETQVDEAAGGTINLHYENKSRDGSFKINSTLSFSFNSEPFVSSNIFKNVVNYNAAGLNESDFVSFNQIVDFSKFRIVLEGEAGKSRENDWIPIYAGLMPSIPIVKELWFRPRFFYYGALNSSDSGAGRSTYEFYPRFWFENKKLIAALGVDFLHKQIAENEWRWEWSIPFLVEYKF